jgi:hypothetical protein
MVKDTKLIRVFLFTSFILLCLAVRVHGQTPVKIDKLPPPPPVPKPKPTPTPRPPKDGEIDVIRVTSNLVVVPVSVTDGTGQPTLGLSAPDFHLEEQGRIQEIVQMGDPEQVPLEIALLLKIRARQGYYVKRK